jgi:hypothetical protein
MRVTIRLPIYAQENKSYRRTIVYAEIKDERCQEALTTLHFTNDA